MRVYLVLDYYCDNRFVAVCNTKKLAKKMVNVSPDRFFIMKAKVASKMPEWFQELYDDQQ